MRLVRTAAEARAAIAGLRAGGQGVGFVPTMGALHDGHASLVSRCRNGPRRSVLSVLVNPLQFGPSEDYASYPRDLERDSELARRWGVDLLFAPEAAELVPDGPLVTVDPGPLGDELEGAVRPGHFRGVLTIVAKLLNIVRPDLAVFGQKDLQQAVLVRAMVRDLDFEVGIEMAPTVRSAEGLALSSRNAYLSEEERRQASGLFRALRTGEDAVRSGERRPSLVHCGVLRALAAAPSLEPEYVAVRTADALAETTEIRGPTALLGAARLGRVRLIDNLIVTPEES